MFLGLAGLAVGHPFGIVYQSITNLNISSKHINLI